MPRRKATTAKTTTAPKTKRTAKAEKPAAAKPLAKSVSMRAVAKPQGKKAVTTPVAPVQKSMAEKRLEHQLDEAQAKLIEAENRHELAVIKLSADRDSWRSTAIERGKRINLYNRFYTKLISTWFGVRQARRAEREAELTRGWRV